MTDMEMSRGEGCIDASLGVFSTSSSPLSTSTINTTSTTSPEEGVCYLACYTVPGTWYEVHGVESSLQAPATRSKCIL